MATSPPNGAEDRITARRAHRTAVERSRPRTWQAARPADDLAWNRRTAQGRSGANRGDAPLAGGHAQSDSSPPWPIRVLPGRRGTTDTGHAETAIGSGSPAGW